VPTIREVAFRAGVSVGTVSNVLGGTVPVSNRRRDRVLRVMQEMNYQPNHLARSLKIRHTKMIGMVIRDITDPVSAQMLRGAEDAAWLKDYLLVTLNSDQQWERERQIVTALRTHRVDGILLTASAGPCKNHIRDVRDAGIPTVCLDREIPGLGLDCVVAGHFEGARECVKHLASLGHQEIGWISGTDADVAQERFAGYIQGLQDAGLEFDQTLAAGAQSPLDDGYHPASQLLARDPRATAILTADARLAAALLRALDQCNLRCPQDVAVATFDDSWLSEALRPSLTAVAQPSYAMGFQATELLIQRIHDPSRSPSKMMIETSLHIRESSGAALSQANNRSNSERVPARISAS
jgi:LacI family transcriptional regulator